MKISPQKGGPDPGRSVSGIGMFHVDHGDIAAVQGLDQCPDLLGHLLAAETEGEGSYHIEDQVGVGRTGDHAEIVDGNGRVDALHQRCHLVPDSGGGAVVIDQGVHMDYRLTAQLPVQLLLQIVNGVMELHDAAGGGDLGVEGDHHPAGTVIMDHQVVDAQDLLVGHHQTFNFLGELRRRRRAQQGIDGVLGGINAALEDEQRYKNAYPAVDGDAEKVAGQGGDEHGGGGDAVAEGVCRRGQQGRGVHLLADGAVIHRHVQLHADGDRQDTCRQPAEIYQSGVKNFRQRFFGQFHAHQQDQHGHRQAGKVLRPAVAEGVTGVRGLGGDAEAQQGHHGGSGVGEVVEGVRRDGDGPGEGARQKLSGEQQHVQADAHNPAEDAVGPAGLRLFPGRVRFDKQPRQQ